MEDTTTPCVFRVHVRLAVDQCEVEACVLIDTGASLSVVRRGLFPDGTMGPATNVRRFASAGGHPIQGGTHGSEVRCTFGDDSDDQYDGYFYEAAIVEDAIVGLGFLKRHQTYLSFDPLTIHIGHGSYEAIEDYDMRSRHTQVRNADDDVDARRRHHQRRP